MYVVYTGDVHGWAQLCKHWFELCDHKNSFLQLLPNMKLLGKSESWTN